MTTLAIVVFLGSLAGFKFKRIDRILSKLEKFELHHKVMVFVSVILLTIALVRTGIAILNPSNPVLFGFSLHHFDYGIFLLMVSALLLIFGKQKQSFYLLLTAIAFGLVLDELWFIRSNIAQLPANELPLYNSTFVPAVILAVATMLTVIVINHFKEKNTLAKKRRSL